VYVFGDKAYDIYTTDQGGSVLLDNGNYAHPVNQTSTTGVSSVNTRTGDVTLTKSDVGLDQADNTSDLAKPVSGPQQTALDNKVDKVAGKQLSDENYSLGEKNKLAGIDDTQYWKGEYLTLAALQAAHPTAVPGSYAYVDGGAGIETLKYIWDSSDAEWVQGGATGSETPASIKVKYESNPDTNAFSDSAKQAVETDLPTAIAGKQDTLQSGVNIKSINNQSILGAGNIDIPVGQSVTTKTTGAAGDLPPWAAWIADASSGPLARPMNPNPVDGEEVTCIDLAGVAETNNITVTAVPPRVVASPTLDSNGQASKWRFDAVEDRWDLVFRNAPSSAPGPGFKVETRTLYVSDGLVSVVDTGAKLSADRREPVDIATYIGADWASEELWVRVEAYNDTGIGAVGWSNPEFFGSSGGYGVRASIKGGEIIVQSGGQATLPGPSNFSGNAYGLTQTSVATVKTRIKVTRLTYSNSFDLVDKGIVDAGVIAFNNRYTFQISSALGSDWVNADILIRCQLQINGEWGDPFWVYDGSGSFGATGATLNTDQLVIQTGNTGLITTVAADSGHGFGDLASAVTSAPCRLVCYKFKSAAIAAGIVRSEIYSLGNVASDTRLVTQVSAIGLDFVGKELEVLCEVQQPTNLWGAAGWYTVSNIGLGCRSNQMYDAIVTQSANNSITSIPQFDGSPHGNSNYTANRYLAPTRLKVWRFG
jgi:hypothetical protein